MEHHRVCHLPRKPIDLNIFVVELSISLAPASPDIVCVHPRQCHPCWSLAVEAEFTIGQESNELAAMASLIQL